MEKKLVILFLPIFIILMPFQAICSEDTLLFEAIMNNNNEEIHSLLKNGSNPDIRMRDGVSPLHLAIRNNNLVAIDLLIKFGAKLNSTDSCNLTPLDDAKIFNSSASVELLCKAAKDKGIDLISNYNYEPSTENPSRFSPTTDENKDEIKIFEDSTFFRVELSPIIITSADEELHYLKLEIVFSCTKGYAELARQDSGKIFAEIRKMLQKYTIQKAKEDYIDRFLHKDIQKCLNQIFGRNNKNGVIKVFIPTFLIN